MRSGAIPRIVAAFWASERWAIRRRAGDSSALGSPGSWVWQPVLAVWLALLRALGLLADGRGEFFSDWIQVD